MEDEEVEEEEEEVEEEEVEEEEVEEEEEEGPETLLPQPQPSPPPPPPLPPPPLRPQNIDASSTSPPSFFDAYSSPRGLQSRKVVRSIWRPVRPALRDHQRPAFFRGYFHPVQPSPIVVVVIVVVVGILTTSNGFFFENAEKRKLRRSRAIQKCYSFSSFAFSAPFPAPPPPCLFLRLLLCLPSRLFLDLFNVENLSFTH